MGDSGSLIFSVRCGVLRVAGGVCGLWCAVCRVWCVVCGGVVCVVRNGVEPDLL